MPLYRCTITAGYHGQTIQNVVHFEDLTSQGGVPPTTQQIAVDVLANWVQAQRNLHHNSLRFNSVAVNEIRNPVPMAAHIEATNLLGTGGASQSHSVSAFKLRMHTNRGGRRGFGKYYIGGIEWSLMIGEGILGQTAIDRLNTLCIGLTARYCQVDNSPVPFHLVLVHKDVNDAPNDINQITFYPNLGSQRRRNKFVGI